MPIVPQGYNTTENNNKKAEIIMQYTEILCKLARDYQSEIAYMDELLKNIRNERNKFYSQQIPQIEESLKQDSVTEENRKKWIEELRENMEKSFVISETLIKDFVTDNLNEYQSELKSAIERI